MERKNALCAWHSIAVGFGDITPSARAGQDVRLIAQDALCPALTGGQGFRARLASAHNSIITDVADQTPLEGPGHV